MKSKRKTVRYVHKKNRSMYITSGDQHGFVIAAARTFASPAVWEEEDYHYYGSTNGFEVTLDIAECDDMRCMRAYKHRKSGVVILESFLYDYEKDKYSPGTLSAFKEITDEHIPAASKEGDAKKEEYYFITKKNFTIRGFDDLGHIAHNMIYIPQKTKFAWVENGIKIKDSYDRERPKWHMTSLRNSELGIEISLPTKYLDLVMEPIKKRSKMPKETIRYPYKTSCMCCHKTIEAPANDPCANNDHDVYVYKDELIREKITVRSWLCDQCYERFFHVHPHAWAFQINNWDLLWC